MKISPINESWPKAARIAGFTYIFTFLIVVAVNFGINEPLIVSGNPAQTIQNIMASEQLFRIGIATNLIYAIGVLVMLIALYTLLKTVNHSLAVFAAGSRLVYALMWVLIPLNCAYVARLLSSPEYLQAFEPQRLEALVRLYLGTANDMYYFGLVFWGLASTVCSYLFFKSRAIPRVLAAFGLIASVWGALCAIAYIISPDFAGIINLWLFDMPLAIFELVTGFWLMLKRLSPSAMPDTAIERIQASAA
jgi:hypothetical protein